MNKNKLGNLQALRAFAASIVVLYHTIITSEAYGIEVKLFSNVKRWGWSGVDIFFVLSGFIMVYILNNKPMSTQKFFVDRLARIAPMYYLMCILMMVTLVFLPSNLISFSELIAHLLASLFFVSNLFLDKIPILSDGWTLEYEMFFYAVMALGLLFGSKLKSQLFVVSVVASAIIFLGLNAVAFEFLIGMVCANAYLSGRGSVGLHAASIAVGVVGYAIAISLDWNDIVIHQNRALIFGVPAMFIVYGLAGIRQIESGILIMLGDASYSIYLVQVFVITLLYKFLEKLHAFKSIGDLYALISLVLTILAGMVLYKHVEKPLTSMLRSIIQVK